MQIKAVKWNVNVVKYKNIKFIALKKLFKKVIIKNFDFIEKKKKKKLWGGNSTPWVLYHDNANISR